jgi:hypothetical protein
MKTSFVLLSLVLLHRRSNHVEAKLGAPLAKTSSERKPLDVVPVKERRLASLSECQGDCDDDIDVSANAT